MALNDKKDICYKQSSCLIRLQLREHLMCFKSLERNIGVISQLTCINDDCGHMCPPAWRTVILPLR